MALPQSTAMEALLQIWDGHHEWSNDRLLALILATIASETDDFKVRAENLSFRSPERIRDLWPQRFPTVDSAEPFVGNPEKLAQEVYGGRFHNDQPGDAYRYRGRGMAMLLGREEYERYGEVIGVDLLSNPEFALNPAIGARIAFAAYFDDATIKKLNAYFQNSSADWKGAPISSRVVDREPISVKSDTIYGCINKVSPK